MTDIQVIKLINILDAFALHQSKISLFPLYNSLYLNPDKLKVKVKQKRDFIENKYY